MTTSAPPNPPGRGRGALSTTAYLTSAETFADALRAEGLNARSLAERIDRTNPSIYQLLSGVRHTCTPDFALRVEAALNVARGSLFVVGPRGGEVIDGELVYANTEAA